MPAELGLLSLGLLAAPKNLPNALKATDGGFTLDSVKRRLPLISQAVVENNPAYSKELQSSLLKLGEEIAADAKLELVEAGPEWANEQEPFLAAGDTWFSAPWFFIENYFYKRILALTDPETGGTDPFAKQKSDSLQGAGDAFARMVSSGLCDCAELAPLVSTSLWGNLADLSLSAGAKLVAPEAASAGSAVESGSMMLADDTALLCERLGASEGKEVIIVLDNCGLELVSDLLLVDGLLRLCPATRVVLHLKDRPVFVSDVCEHDVGPTLDWMVGRGGGALVGRLRASLDDGRLAVAAPEFYTSGRPFWQMPESLQAAYAKAAIVVLKGDANYRRLLGDLHWPHDTPFAPLMEYWPTSLAALRTCKSGVLVGTQPEVEAAAAAAHPDKWLTGGLYGMVQCRACD